MGFILHIRKIPPNKLRRMEFFPSNAPTETLKEQLDGPMDGEGSESDAQDGFCDNHISVLFKLELFCPLIGQAKT
jgi:hypothetical protein